MERDEARVVGTDRRDFIKKAGVAAWTIPAVQVVNMTGALAGGTNTSVTTTTTPTTKPPCETVKLRLKAVLGDGDGDGFHWVTSYNEGDCVKDDIKTIDPSNLPIKVGQREGYVVVTHEIRECRILYGAAKGHTLPDDQEVDINGNSVCLKGEVGGGGAYVKWRGEAGERGIYQVEVVVECCLPE